MIAGFIHKFGAVRNGNLDAFNDVLAWLRGENALGLTWSATCERSLSHAAQAAWLRDTLATCHPSNVADTRSRLAQAEAGQGPTLSAVIREIIAVHPQVRLVLR